MCFNHVRQYGGAEGSIEVSQLKGVGFKPELAKLPQGVNEYAHSALQWTGVPFRVYSTNRLGIHYKLESWNTCSFASGSKNDTNCHQSNLMFVLSDFGLKPA